MPSLMLKIAIIIILCLTFFSSCISESIPSALTLKSISETSEVPDVENLKINTSPPVIKIIIQDEGVYQITQAEIQKLTNGLGYIQKAELYHRGKPYPTWTKVTNRQTALRFYAPEPGSRYTSSGIYWMFFRIDPVEQLASGILPEVDATRSPEFVPIVSVYEENLIYEPSSSDKIAWFWKKLPSGNIIDINLLPSAQLSGGDRLRLKFWAKTGGQISIDGLYPHTIGLSLDNVSLGEFQWNGAGFYEIEVLLDPGLPESKYRSIKIQSNRFAPSANDILWLDKITIFANGILNSKITPVKFMGTDSNVNTVMGPENTMIAFHQGLPVKIFHALATDNNSNQVSLSAVAGYEYLLFAEKDVRKLDKFSIVVAQPSRVAIEQFPDYIIIGLDEYYGAAQRLLEWRSAQGFNAAYMSMEEIASNYGYGYPEPDAIRKFLSELYSQNKSRAIYVLLLGDFSHTREQVSLEGGLTFIPSELIYTELGGWTVSDTSLVDFDQNGIPDIPIGRLPVANVDHAKAAIQKIIDYETGLALNPLSFLPLIDAQSPIFSKSAETFSNQIESANLSGRSVILPAVKNQETLLQTAQEHSINLLVFFGHGSLTQLGEPPIIDDQHDLNLPGPSILIAFTCLAGYFAHPEQNSLVENLLVTETGGLVAGLAPTSLTLLENQESLVISLAKHISEEPDSRLGNVFLLSLNDAWNDASNIDLLRTFLILGDPALLISR